MQNKILLLIKLVFLLGLINSSTYAASENEDWIKSLQWQSIKGGQAIDVGSNSKNIVYTLSQKGRAYRWAHEDNWQLLPGYFKRIAVDSSHKPWAIDKDNLVRRYNGLWWDLKNNFQAIDIGTGTDGSVALLDIKGQPYQWNQKLSSWNPSFLLGHNWHHDPGLHITIDSTGALWVVTVEGKILRQGETSWVTITGHAQDISAGKDMVVLIVNHKQELSLYDLKTQAWLTLPKITDSIAVSVGENGSPWIINKQGKLMTAATFASPKEREEKSKEPDIATELVENTPSESDKTDLRKTGFIAVVGVTEKTTREPFLFKLLPNSAGQDIEIGPDGSVFLVDADGFLQRWQNNRNQFVNFPGSLKRISVDPYGLPWGINTAGDVFRHSNGDWKQIKNSRASDISIGLYGEIYITNSAENVFRYNVISDRFERLFGVFGSRIAVAQDESIWLVRQDGRVFECTAKKCSYRSRRDGRDIAIGPEGSVFITTQSKRLLRWDSENKRWVKKFDKAFNVSVGPKGYPWVTSSNNKVWRTVFFDRDESEDLDLALKTNSPTSAQPTTTLSNITITKKLSFANVKNPSSSSDLWLTPSADEAIVHLIEPATSAGFSTWVNSSCLATTNQPECIESTIDPDMQSICPFVFDPLDPSFSACASCNDPINQSTPLCTENVGLVGGGAWVNGICLIDPSNPFCGAAADCGDAGCVDCSNPSEQLGNVCVQLGNGGASSVSGDSTVWVSSSSGTYFKKFSRVPNEQTSWIVEDEEGRHWAIDNDNQSFRETTPGGGRYKQILGTIPLTTGSNLRQIAVGGGKVFALNDAGEIYRYDDNRKRFIRFDQNQIAHRIAVDPEGSLWILNTSDQLKRYQDDIAINVPKRGINIANEISIGANGSVFIIKNIATSRKLFKYSAANDRFDEIKMNISDPNHLTVDNVGRPWIINTDPKIFRAR